MRKSHVINWLRALRSGEFKQHRGSVCNEMRGEDKLQRSDAFCCIGVAAVVNRVPPIPYLDTAYCGKELNILMTNENKYIGEDGSERTGSDYDYLIHMNDKEKKSFKEIADWIEANILPNATEG